MYRTEQIFLDVVFNALVVSGHLCHDKLSRPFSKVIPAQKSTVHLEASVILHW
jgi:hypothetical protein